MAKLRSEQNLRSSNSNDENARLARHGLALPRTLLQALEKSGIYCYPGISIEHQHLSGRFVLKGTESGGSVESIGRYCGYLGLDGQALPWLQPLDSFGGNGRHAIVIATELVRIEMLRVERTYDLLISRHLLSQREGYNRPAVASTILFRGKAGSLASEIVDPGFPQLRDGSTPIFYTSAGEIHEQPPKFVNAIRAVTAAVGCVRCKHAHLAVRPSPSA